MLHWRETSTGKEAEEECRDFVFFPAGGRERRKWRWPSLADESEFVPKRNIYEVCEPSDSPQRKGDDSETGGGKKSHH